MNGMFWLNSFFCKSKILAESLGLLVNKEYFKHSYSDSRPDRRIAQGRALSKALSTINRNIPKVNVKNVVT